MTPDSVFIMGIPERRMSEIDCWIWCFAKATYQPCDKIDPSSCNLDPVYAICKDKSPGSECYTGTTEEVVILKQTDNHRYPDAALTEATKPLITVEVGITQSLESLFCDCRQYLRDGTEQIVIVVKLHEEDAVELVIGKAIDHPPKWQSTTRHKVYLLTERWS